MSEEDYIVDFSKVQALPPKLSFREQGPYEKLIYQFFLNKDDWHEITEKIQEGLQPFPRILSGLRLKGLTVIQRTHSDRTVHHYAKWELPVTPAEYNRMSSYEQRELRRRRPKHD